LVLLYQYISNLASPKIANNYVNAIADYCESLKNFPERGNKRDDIRLGLRTTHYKKRALIAFAAELNRVSIIGIFYGGQDYETDLKSNFED
jgi:plasmid stabilization system protein ParE